MASLDPSRSAVEVDELELTVANLLLNSPDDELLATANARKGLRKLEKARIANDGVIDGYPAMLLRVVLQPELRLLLERFASDEPLREFAYVAGGVGVWGEAKAGASSEFTPIEPELIPWQVARSVGLGPRPRSRRLEPLEFRALTLDGALAHIAAGDLDAAAAKLGADPGIDDTGRNVLMELLLLRRLSWRAVSMWTTEDGEKHAEGVAAIDGGDAGLWLSDRTSDATDKAVIRLEPTESSVVWDRIVNLVPYPVGTDAGASV